ncbi:ABC transporter ATP-binding protein [Senegalia massiliensis]|uniref:ABC transporter ATP-binding protein n=1 Tax=Senegalia massiliensis TaxID=1720316 RepID=UPI002433872B|nr:ABC transporter ATP-binding protein [Senegalia massiliensis]
MFVSLRAVKDKDSVNWVIKKLKLEKYESKKVKHLSLGNAQRLGIAKAIIHKPKILLLDEPTNGLDPAGIVEVLNLLMDLAKNSGVTILVSSHKLNEISRIATNIAIIHDGELIKKIDRKQLEHELKKYLLIDGKDKNTIKSVLYKFGYKANIVSNGNSSVLQIHNEDAVKNPEKIVTLLVNNGYRPKMLKIKKEDLEEYFLRSIEEFGGGLK